MSAAVASRSERASLRIRVRSVGMGKPRAWLSAGMQDFRHAPAVSLAYGVFWVGLSIAITAGAVAMGYWYLLLPLVAGFMIVGPLVAVGSFGIARALEEGRSPTLGDAFGGWRAHAGQLIMMGFMLALVLLAWFNLAMILFALFFGMEIPNPTEFYSALLTTPRGWGLLLTGTIAGAGLAFGAFTISVVAVPTLMDQDLTFMEGIEASVRTVGENLLPMLVWAAMLTGAVVIGVLTFYVGLALILPVLGFASWHAYEDLVRIEKSESV